MANPGSSSTNLTEWYITTDAPPLNEESVDENKKKKKTTKKMKSITPGGLVNPASLVSPNPLGKHFL